MDELRVFIGWSGDRSHAVAKHINRWVSLVLPGAQPWLSSESIAKGSPWLAELTKNLSATAFGLFVLTSENKDVPWLVFEAGVISKALPETHCCPVRCDLKQSDILGPLSLFQSASVTERDDMLKLVKTMNASSAKPFDEAPLSKWFSDNWDDFLKAVTEALETKPPRSSPVKEGPTQEQLLEEILTVVRRVEREVRRSGAEVQSLSAPGIWSTGGSVGFDNASVSPILRHLLKEADEGRQKEKETIDGALKGLGSFVLERAAQRARPPDPVVSENCPETPSD